MQLDTSVIAIPQLPEHIGVVVRDIEHRQDYSISFLDICRWSFTDSNFGGEMMAAKIVIPIVGDSGQKYDIVKLVEWKAEEGALVEKGSTVLLVETEKASCEIEAEAPGLLHILVPKGGKAMVGAVVGLIAETREELAELQKVPPEKLAQGLF
jgi:hypothetical protein